MIKKNIIWLSVVAGIIFTGSVFIYKYIPLQKKNTPPSPLITKKIPRRVSGIFQLPGDGTVIKQTEDGYELSYPSGIFVHFEQNGTPGEFRLINEPGDKYGSWTTSLFRGVSGPTDGPGTIKLSSSDEKPHKIKVWLSRYRT